MGEAVSGQLVSLPLFCSFSSSYNMLFSTFSRLGGLLLLLATSTAADNEALVFARPRNLSPRPRVDSAQVLSSISNTSTASPGTTHLIHRFAKDETSLRSTFDPSFSDQDPAESVWMWRISFLAMVGLPLPLLASLALLTTLMRLSSSAGYPHLPLILRPRWFAFPLRLRPPPPSRRPLDQQTLHPRPNLRAHAHGCPPSLMLLPGGSTCLAGGGSVRDWTSRKGREGVRVAGRGRRERAVGKGGVQGEMS